jgi:hypothetical protein
MRLHLPEFLRHLSTRPMTLMAEHGMRSLPPGDRNRQVLASTFRPMLHQAGKFIFDSGSDADGETTQAIKETSVAMLEDGRFHLPFPTTWIEDPFETDPTGEHRNYYLACEKDRLIRVWTAFRLPYPAPQNFYLCALPLIIDLDRPSDEHAIPMDLPPEHPGHNPTVFHRIQGLLAQADYAFRKFIVTLGSGGIEREEVSGGRLPSGTKRSTGGPRKPHGEYPYTVIRIPNEPASGSGGPSIGPRRRRHFVRGFVWGKNTRPREEQRWVAGYYRGAAELGEAERSHYEMRAGEQR